MTRGRVWEELSEDIVQMIFIQCPKCQYHMGVDYTYLDQVGPIDTTCPACKCSCHIPAIDDEEDE